MPPAVEAIVCCRNYLANRFCRDLNQIGSGRFRSYMYSLDILSTVVECSIRDAKTEFSHVRRGQVTANVQRFNFARLQSHWVAFNCFRAVCYIFCCGGLSSEYFKEESVMRCARTKGKKCLACLFFQFISHWLHIFVSILLFFAVFFVCNVIQSTPPPLQTLRFPPNFQPHQIQCLL